MNRRLRIPSTVCLSVALLGVQAAFAQTAGPFAQVDVVIAGIVSDPAGARVADTTVLARRPMVEARAASISDGSSPSAPGCAL